MWQARAVPRPLLARAAAVAALSAIGSVPVLAACGPDVETCEDKLELRFDEPVARDYILVLTIGEQAARIDCSLATYPTEKEANPVNIEVELEGTLEGRARCTENAVVVVGLTPDAGRLGVTYRLIDSTEIELLESDFSVSYEEVEAKERTCRQGVVILDVGCLEGTTCNTGEGGGGGAGGTDLPT